MRVAFLTTGDEHRPSSRVRAYQYVQPLQAMGHEVRVVPWPTRRADRFVYAARALAAARWADVTVLQKVPQPERFIDVVTRVARRVVVDIDDAVWAPLAPIEREVELARRRQARLHRALARADLLITGSDWLAARLAPACPTVTIPPSVDLDRYPPPPPPAGRPVVLGWLGSPVNLDDLEPATAALRATVGTGRVSLTVVSSTAPALDGVPFDFEPWGAGTEVASLHRFDVGLMPLRDEERSRGRCGFKAVQYMAAGRPVISSPVGGAAEVVDHGVTGLVVDGDDGWIAAIEQLAGDPALRERMGAAGRARVEQGYSVQANAVRLARALEEAGS